MTTDAMSVRAACQAAYDEACRFAGQPTLSEQLQANADAQAVLQGKIDALTAQLAAAKADMAAVDSADAAGDAARAKVHTDLGG